VVSVHVGEKDSAYSGQTDRAHKLPLRAFAAIDQNPLSSAYQQEAG
jgi:hypothetical protein